MKLQSILLLTGIAAGLMTTSCKSLEDEAREFYGPPPKVEGTDAEDEKANDYYDKVNAHIDRRLNEFNEKEEAKLPVFSSKEVKDEFMGLSFIKSAEQISVLSIDFAGPKNTPYKFLFDRESRTFTRTIGDKTETFAFETFTNGVPPVIPYDAHILYAFISNFNRIAETVTLRSYEKLERGENPAIADLENEANLDEKGNKIDKNKPEVKPKTTTEPLEFRIDNRWCKCYDVKLKSICAPAVSMSLFVNNEEKTISRLDVIMDDDSKTSFIMDWREQDGIVLPRVVQRLGDNAVFFREDARVILKNSLPPLDMDAIRDAAAEAAAGAEEPEEEEMIEIDASGAQDNEDVGIDAASEDGSGEDDAFAEEEEDVFEEE